MKVRRHIFKNLLAALSIVFISSLPYLHDVITIRGEGLKGWVPDFGLQELLTDVHGGVMGFSSYRVFIYMLFIHLFSHIGWVGWFLDARGKSYRFFLLVPVILSGYTVALLLLNARATAFNEFDTKLYITLGLSIILILHFFMNRKTPEEDENI